MTIAGTDSLAIPVGCLTLYNGEWVQVTWNDPRTFGWDALQLTQQNDGNLVLTESSYSYIGSSGHTTGPTAVWSSGTTFAGNSAGPGCLTQFTSSADLVVDNCDGTKIWDSGTQNDADALLAFPINNGPLTIYQSSAGTVLWSE
jgi:hypothetical protein